MFPRADTYLLDYCQQVLKLVIKNIPTAAKVIVRMILRLPFNSIYDVSTCEKLYSIHLLDSHQQVQSVSQWSHTKDSTDNAGMRMHSRGIHVHGAASTLH